MTPSSDLLLTGLPRGGTTLLCRLVADAENTVALFEPMDVLSLPLEPPAAIEAIGAFVRAARVSLLETGHAPSKLVGGDLTDNPFRTDGDPAKVRSPQASDGLLKATVRCPDFLLAVKHNAAFLALLPALATVHPMLAIVRNPLSVLCSWQTVDLPVRRGQMPAAERLSPELRSALARCPSILARQVALLRWCFERLRSLPAANVLRYESLIDDGVQSLYRQMERPRRVDAPSRIRSADVERRLYSAVDVRPLKAALASFPDAWQPWYSADDLEAAQARLLGHA